MRTLAMMAIGLLGLAGCAGPSVSYRSHDALARRSAALRGATDAEWETIRQIHDRGDRLDSRYVFAVSEFRIGAIRAQTMSLIGTPQDREETTRWLTEAEESLPKLLATRSPLPPRADAAAR